MKKVILLLSLLLLLSCSKKDSLFFVFLHSNPDKAVLSEDSVMSLQSAHIANINRLAREGILKAAGPFEGGGGLFILNTSSREELDSILATDAAIAAGRFLLELHPMEITEGNLCPTDTTFNMETYRFIGFSNFKKQESEEFEFLLNKNEVRKIFAFRFTDTKQENYILQSKNTIISDSLFKNPPFGNKIYFNKDLWIAKETFSCD